MGKRVMGNEVEKTITLSEWLIQEYGNKKAWKAGTDKQIKKVDVQKVLGVFGRERLLHQAKQLKEGVAVSEFTDMTVYLKSHK